MKSSCGGKSHYYFGKFELCEGPQGARTGLEHVFTLLGVSEKKRIIPTEAGRKAKVFTQTKCFLKTKRAIEMKKTVPVKRLVREKNI